MVDFHSRNEAIQYGNRLNRSIQSLLQDVHNNFVYAYPSTLQALAKATPLPALADKYNALADVMQKRMDGRSDLQVKKEVEFSTTYQDYVNKWEVFYDQLLNDIIAPIGDWDSLDGFDSEFRQYYSIYQDVAKTSNIPDGSKKPSLPLPKTEVEIQKEHPKSGILGSLGALIGDIPWTPILLIGGGYLIWTQRESIKAAFKDSPEEKKEIPEKAT